MAFQNKEQAENNSSFPDMTAVSLVIIIIKEAFILLVILRLTLSFEISL